MTSPRIEIVKELRALEQFCTFKAVRSGEEQERFLKDYLADIQEFPLEAIQQACAAWRKTGATKFPNPGQLIPLIREALPPEQRPRIEAWRPISDAEYDALTLREKIRHHRILAHEARGKAGPMFRNTSMPGPISKASGVHLKPQDMPDIWRSWNRVADGHEAEAKRLSEYLHRKPVAAE